VLMDRAERLGSNVAEWGHTLGIDWLGLLGERAAVEALEPRGRISCGGATHLMECADSWLAVSLARQSDAELVPAWLAIAGDPDPWPHPAPARPGHMVIDAMWQAVANRVRDLPGSTLAMAAEVLGLPVGVLGEHADGPDRGVTLHQADRGPTSTGPPKRVVDLSSLWAGPLCASLLGRCGAEVLKVSSRYRPDGTTRGNPEWYAILNGAKTHVELALDTAGGRAQLVDLLATADVVVESARPRALEQMGVIANEVLGSTDGPRAWVSITGHGRASSRVAFGDDAAVAGGLVVEDGDGPWFCADAVADPLSGIAAADAAIGCLVAGSAALVEVSMAGVAASHAGPTLAPPATARPPRARGVPASAGGTRR
jgi:hypothetical protein